LPEWFVFQAVLSWPSNGISIAENVGICVRIDATFVLIPETSDRIDATCVRMVVSVTEIFVSSEKIDVKERQEQSCAPTAEKSGATRVIFDTTIAI
jgi:hypothetical protein